MRFKKTSSEVSRLQEGEYNLTLEDESYLLRGRPGTYQELLETISDQVQEYGDELEGVEVLLSMDSEDGSIRLRLLKDEKVNRPIKSEPVRKIMKKCIESQQAEQVSRIKTIRATCKQVLGKKNQSDWWVKLTQGGTFVRRLWLGCWSALFCCQCRAQVREVSMSEEESSLSERQILSGAKSERQTEELDGQMEQSGVPYRMGGRWD